MAAIKGHASLEAWLREDGGRSVEMRLVDLSIVGVLSPLLMCVQMRAPDKVQLLLDAMADPDSLPSSDLHALVDTPTPLIAACALASPACLRALLEAGARVDVTSACDIFFEGKHRHARTPIEWARHAQCDGMQSAAAQVVAAVHQTSHTHTHLSDKVLFFMRGVPL